MAIPDLKRFMIPGALVIGGVTAGSMLAPVALASAADDTTDSTDESTDETVDTPDSEADSDVDERRARHRRHHRLHAARHLAADVVTETLDMTEDELRDAFSEGKSLADIAADQGVAVDDLKAALEAAATERIDQAVEDERIDADRAAEMKENLGDRIDELIERTPGDRFGRGHGHHAHGGGEALAEFLGLSVDELRAAMADGGTLAELAEAQGVSEDDLVAFLLDSVEERLDQAVENGRLDADDAEDKLDGAAERIEEHINSEFGERPGRKGHGHRHGPADSSLDA